jgi:hypothetical protein
MNDAFPKTTQTAAGEGSPGTSARGDALIGQTTRAVAAWLDALSGEQIAIGERKHMQPQARLTLGVLQEDIVDPGEQNITLENWDRAVGGIDVIARWPDGRPRFVAELKLRETYWMLWDAYKLLDTFHMDGVEAAYLIVGASAEAWGATYTHCPRDRRTTELFEPGAIEHSSAELFQTNAHAWYDLLYGGRARPTRVPARVRTVRVENAPMRIDGADGFLRCVRVESASEDWLDFSAAWYAGEWPVGVQPCEHYLEWRGVERQ